MKDVCREVNKIQEAKGAFFFCWKEILLFSKTELGKGEPSAAKFIDALFRIH